MGIEITAAAEALEATESKELASAAIETKDADLLPKEIGGVDDAKGLSKEIGSSEYTEKNATNSVKEKDISEQQELADKTAQEYNKKYTPYERGVNKGIENLEKTSNGGVSFEKTDGIYITEDGTKCVVTIEATGNRSKDFDEANKKVGMDKTPKNYVWHHVDNYNVKDNTIKLELVREDYHNATKPHSGGCAQYDAVHGSSYNPARKDV